MCNSRPIPPPPPVTRRRFLQGGGAAAAALLVPAAAAAAPPKSGVVNPYTGRIPLYFPLPPDTYRTPVVDNWHDLRVGDPQPWSHLTSGGRRAHDGLDLFPRLPTALPPVYAPFEGIVVATNVVGVGYRQSGDLPWNYNTTGRDTTANALYGNFVWLRSTANDESAGYYAFYCHLQAEMVIKALEPGVTMVSPATQVGVLGDTGNADGDPQLHLELHYPSRTTFICRNCPSGTPPRTAINPQASLARAKPHPTP